MARIVVPGSTEEVGSEPPTRVDRELLDIYLADHFAGATGGLDLAKRMAKGDPTDGTLSQIAGEIETDRKTLRDVMAALDLSPSLVKSTIGWLAEKAGRLKLNDRVLGPSPLSPLLELEGLIAGVSGKLQLWRALAQLAPADPRLARFDFGALAERAETQRRRLEGLHQQAASQALVKGDA
jgi:hypothetical protein